MGSGKKLKWNKVPEGIFIYHEFPKEEMIDYVIQVNVK